LRDDDGLKHRGNSAKISGLGYFLKGHTLVYFHIQERKHIFGDANYNALAEKSLEKIQDYFNFFRLEGSTENKY
jgi:hypothetical protein